MDRDQRKQHNPSGNIFVTLATSRDRVVGGAGVATEEGILVSTAVYFPAVPMSVGHTRPSNDQPWLQGWVPTNVFGARQKRPSCTVVHIHMHMS